MKYITFTIPCYNSENYMEKAIQSILPAGEDVEILIVNDGSSDGTEEIGRKYAREYPSIIKVISKENGGHGDAVNSGLSQAAGKYFKVVDSDDWVDGESLLKILEKVKEFDREGTDVDMLVSNYVYEKVGMERKKVIHYRNVLPQNEVFRWEDIGSFHLDQYILMHSVMYRTEILRLSQLKLPKHTFYVDNIYVYYPLPHVRKLYYMDVDFYRYFIVTDKKLRKYMINYLAIMMTVSSILCIRSKNAENLEKKKELWIYLRQKDYKTFLKIRYGILGQTMNLPGRSGRKVSSMAYSVARRLIGFN